MLSILKNVRAPEPFSEHDADESSMARALSQDHGRLARERAAAQAKLDALDAELQRLESERGLNEAFDAEAPARLHVLAHMGPVLLTPLHAVLGYAQILRMDTSLNGMQSAQVGALFAAASHLLGCVQRALSLADEHEHLTDAEFGEDQIAGFTDAASGPWPRSHEQVSFSSRSGPACGPAIQAQAGSVARSLHVLVADDSAMNREIAAAFLREAGHIVSLAESGAEAVSIAAAATLDVILMDVRMPEMDGLEATRHIRRLPGDNAVVPIIALTALSSAQDVDTCIKVGMNGHLTKPFSRETLNEVLTRAVPPRASRTGNLAIVHDPAGMPAAGAAMKRHGLESLARLAVHPEQSAAWRVAGARPDADPAPPAWLDIDNPWSRTSQRSRSSQQPRTPGGNFQIKLTAMTVKGRQRLFSGGLSCKPQAHRDQHGFHWLVFVDRDLATIGHFTVQCDLWRWVHGRWASATVAGAVFTPDEMFDQGWRYCGPCEDRAAQIEITARTRQDEPEPTS